MNNEYMNSQDTQVAAPGATSGVINSMSDDEVLSNNKIRFFSSCSRSLKRFSIILFIINIFVAIGLTGALVISLFFKVGLDMLGFLAFPIVIVFILLLIIARFISALVYGFAEIVEKAENK